jgi:hypothetical protein
MLHRDTKEARMPERNNKPEVIWSRKGARGPGISWLRLWHVIIFAFVTWTVWEFGKELGSPYAGHIMLAVGLTIALISELPRTYTLTAQTLSARIGWVRDWSVPLEDVTKVSSSYSSGRDGSGSGMVTVSTSSKSVVLVGIYDADLIEKQILALARQRREALGLAVD